LLDPLAVFIHLLVRRRRMVSPENCIPDCIRVIKAWATWVFAYAKYTFHKTESSPGRVASRTNPRTTKSSTAAIMRTILLVVDFNIRLPFLARYGVGRSTRIG
jgi:hypothetical protein